VELTKLCAKKGITDTFLYGENEELTPSNPFLEHQQKESATDLALQELQVNNLDVVNRHFENQYLIFRT
jgi:hypothetical protein